jgi:Aspartyl protease
MNSLAVQGCKLSVMIRLESGEELPFFIDTGSPTTVFDKSLEPKLGQRLGEAAFTNFGNKLTGGFYKTPKLYLGGTLLMTTSIGIITLDGKPAAIKFGRPIMGILGMDVLEHYCIQLDFAAGKIRFLDSRQLNRAKLGKAFPIFFSTEGQSTKGFITPYIHYRGLIGDGDPNVLIDTGYPGDAASDSELFQREVVEHRLRMEDAVHGDSGRVWMAKSVWNGDTYTNLLVGDRGHLIGLRFLERHLVTLDFPGRMMYLKQTSVGPWADESIHEAEAYLNKLKENGQLPGWSKQDKGTIYWEAFPDYDEFDCRKNDGSADYHYKVVCISDNSPTLQKAWRTDQNNHTIEEYPVP